MFPPFISKRFGARNGVAIYSYIFTAFALASILGCVLACFVFVWRWSFVASCVPGLVCVAHRAVAAMCFACPLRFFMGLVARPRTTTTQPTQPPPSHNQSPNKPHTKRTRSSIIAKKLVAYFGGYDNVFKVFAGTTTGALGLAALLPEN
jgi:MFS family permease